MVPQMIIWARTLRRNPMADSGLQRVQRRRSSRGCRKWTLSSILGMLTTAASPRFLCGICLLVPPSLADRFAHLSVSIAR